MPITLSFYDVFSNTVPGLIFLFAVNEFLKITNLRYVDIESANFDLTQNIAILFCAFLAGNILNTFTYRGWFRVFIRRSINQMALERIKHRYPKLKILFRHTDDEILFTTLQYNDKGLADRFETHRANAIMMRNVSFSLSLLGVLQLVQAFSASVDMFYLMLGVLCFILSGIALIQSARYYEWFYSAVFKASLIFGNSLDAVLRNTQSRRSSRKNS